MKAPIQSQTPRFVSRAWLLLLVAAIAISGCGSKAKPTPSPTRTPTTAPAPTSTAPEASVAPVQTAATPAAAPVSATDRIVPVPSGGSIHVPEGALPQDVQVIVATAPMPLLPDDVEPLGVAIAVTASQQPAEPVMLRLPVPTDATAADNLAIIRVESDGTTTFLITELIGGELVAYAPGFSTFSIGALLAETKVVLVGSPEMSPGQRRAFYTQSASMLNVKDAGWRVTGDFTLVFDSATAAIVQAGNGPGGEMTGDGFLSYECLDLERGRRWWGWRPLYIKPAASKFAVSLITHTPLVYAGDDVQFTASAYGELEGPITWSWDFGNGEKGELSSEDAADRNVELPLTRYAELQERATRQYWATITARDARGRVATRETSVFVAKRPFQVALDGPERIAWSDPIAYGTCQATASGGSPPYAFTFSLLPGSKRSEGSASGEASSQATFPFDQPGGYLLEVSVEDRLQATTRALLPIRVVGGEVLSTRILDMPEVAAPGAKVTLNTQIRGGVLVAAGKKGGYTFLVDWDDGTETPLIENVGVTGKPQEGTILALDHSYREAGSYTVRVEGTDVTGTSDYDTRTIAITDAAPTATSVAEAEPTPGLLVWVRQEPAVVNANKDPTTITALEARFDGSVSETNPTETSFATREKYVDHGTEFYDVTIICSFDTPPLVLNPGLRYSVKVSCANSGSNPGGDQSLGERFWYSAQRGFESIVEPREVLNYFPWSTTSDVTSNKEWMIAAPASPRPGDTFQLYAGFWNRPPCNVTWTYKAEYH